MVDAITNADRLFKIIQRCQKNWRKPDLHSFVVMINGGKAFVECRKNEVYIEARLYAIDHDEVNQWCGTAVAAANRLTLLGADYETVDI